MTGKAGGTSSDVRLGLVGFGKVVRDYYLPALRRLDGAQIVAVADPMPESRIAARRLLRDAQIYSGHRTMLGQAQIDGILVASPPSTHFEVWSDAAADGLPAFVEKPLALSSQLTRISFHSEPRIMIDFNRRFWPLYRRAGDLVRRGILGSPVQLEFGLHLDVFRWTRITRHRLDENEGGPMHDLGSHAIDLTVEIMGTEPDAVSAVASSRRWTDDTIRLSLSFPTGSVATCNLTYGNRTREWLVVRGPESTLRITEPNRAIHVESRTSPSRPLFAWSLDTLAIAHRAFRRSQSFGQMSIRRALAAFIHSIRSGSPCVPGFDEGLRNARWVAAAVRSAAEGGIAQEP